VESFHHFFVINGGSINLGEDSAAISHCIVDAITLDAVVVLDAFSDIIHCFALHLLIGRNGDNGYHEENEQEYGKDNDFP
jgi:hypothetical protein